MSRQQDLARRRNFNKFRLMGFSLDSSAMTTEEWRLYNLLRSTLIRDWNHHSRQLGLNPKERAHGF